MLHKLEILNKTFKILNDWISSPDNVCKDFKYIHPREQECLNILQKNKYFNNIKIIKSYEMNGIDGKWIKHFIL